MLQAVEPSLHYCGKILNTKLYAIDSIKESWHIQQQWENFERILKYNSFKLYFISVQSYLLVTWIFKSCIELEMQNMKEQFYFKNVYGLCYLKLFRIILQILFYLNLVIIVEVSLSSSYYLVVRYNLKYMPRLLVIELHG